MKAQNQPNQTNLKLCQDKKELHKERKMFNVMMVEGRNELRQGAGVEATQQQASTYVESARYSWKSPLNLNCVKFCFAAASLCLFFLVSFLVLVIILNLIPDFENFFG